MIDLSNMNVNKLKEIKPVFSSQMKFDEQAYIKNQKEKEKLIEEKTKTAEYIKNNEKHKGFSKKEIAGIIAFGVMVGMISFVIPSAQFFILVCEIGLLTGLGIGIAIERKRLEKERKKKLINEKQKVNLLTDKINELNQKDIQMMQGLTISRSKQNNPSTNQPFNNQFETPVDQKHQPVKNK